MHYSPTTKGFYLTELHGDAIPSDAVEITAEAHVALMTAQAQGAVIQPDANGNPVAVFPDPPTAAEVLAAERAGMVVSRFQARAALFNAGLLAGIEAAVAAADPFTQIAWADATEFRRNSPTIAALAAALELPDETLDQLFRDAAQIAA
jgi:hypothetical protein